MQEAVLAQKLIKRYPGGIQALDGVSLRINGGEMFGLLGPNGAGKTSLIRILTTLARPTGGQVTLFGVDPAVRPHEARSMIGYVAQEVALDKVMTGREHLELHAAPVLPPFPPVPLQLNPDTHGIFFRR